MVEKIKRISFFLSSFLQIDENRALRH